MPTDAFNGDLVALESELADRQAMTALSDALAATDEEIRKAALLRLAAVRPGALQALVAGLELRRLGAIRH